MEVTRDIVVDLLPLYRSGEASRDTRAAVEEYLQRDPSLGRLADAGEDESAVASAPSLADDIERSAVERTRRRLRARSWTLAIALLCTLLPFSFGIGSGFNFVMFRDVPWSRALWAVAVVLWIWYVRLHRGARTAGF
ncbi:MAG TPA: hypothetical protein VH740_21265 [Vicinamibacterales bacterium]|jgi:hypothetical protein